MKKGKLFDKLEPGKRAIALNISTQIIHALVDIALLVLAYLLAYGIAYNLGKELSPPNEEIIVNFFGNSLYATAAVFVFVMLAFVYVFGAYKLRWKYTTTIDILRLFGGTAVGFLFILLLTQTFLTGVYVSFLVLFWVISFLFLMAARFFNRFFTTMRHFLRRTHALPTGAQNALIYGAGYVGRMIIEQLSSNADSDYIPVGIIDDDPNKKGIRIGDVEVMGSREKLAHIVDKTKAQSIIIAIQRIPKKQLKELFMTCKETGLEVKIVPSIVDGQKEFNSLEVRDVKTEELLGRDEFAVNMDLINYFIRDKVILVTGGAGSIGSELCRQALEYDCKHLIVFDVTENSMFFLNQEFSQKYDKSRYTLVIGSVRDKAKLKSTFDEFRPDVVFHAAAYKHVPMMEFSPAEAIKNNVIGTRNVIEQCDDSGVAKFILISTDKAVNPANIMGASKRIAEMVVQTMSKKVKTQLAAVRFGNVLGSAGSVVGIFLEQIRKGEPLTLTDRNIKRYFMTIPEACRLVMQAGALAQRGEVFVLDMGDPVYIYDLACDLIKMNGLVPNKDIEIIVTGLRPGEKMFEELRYDGESADETLHKGIFTCKLQDVDAKAFSDAIQELEASVKAENIAHTVDIINRLVPSAYRNIQDYDPEPVAPQTPPVEE